MPKFHIALTLLAAGLLAPLAATAQTVAVDTAALPHRAAHGDGQISPLALASDGKPLTALLRIPDGKVLAPHGAGTTAILTVLSGTISWGDGDQIDPSKERTFGPGSVLRVQGNHWAAARNGEVLAQVVRLPEGSKLTPVSKGENKQAAQGN